MDKPAIDSSHSFRVIEGDITPGLILLCDHATNWLPDKYGTLGLDKSQFSRHIAYDIGAEGLTRGLAERLNVPAIMTSYSRLLIDPNRGINDPTLIMKLSDGAVIPGNHPIDVGEVETRVTKYYQPYHDKIGALIDYTLGHGVVPAIFSIHSFTDNWKGAKRPWHAGILWDNDPRFARELLKQFGKQKDIVVGDNEPYDGALGGDTMFRHCTRRGLAHGLLEVRQDLIETEAGITKWVARVAQALVPALKNKQLHKVEAWGSRTGPVEYEFEEDRKIAGN